MPPPSFDHISLFLNPSLPHHQTNKGNKLQRNKTKKAQYLPHKYQRSSQSNMAEECAESCSVTTYSSSAVVPQNKWWDLHGAAGPAALSSWCNNSNTSPNSDINPWHHHQAAAPPPNHSSNSDEDVSISTSFTNASNHSGLTVESSRRLLEPAASSCNDLIAPEQQAPSDSHIWSHVFL